MTQVREVLRVRTADGVAVALTRVGSPTSLPAVLLIHGFGQNRYLFDLPGRSFAEFLRREGFLPYVLELRGHGLSRGRGGPYARRLADYADLDLPAAFGAIRASGAERVFVVGHSMGGLAFLAAAPALHAMASGIVVMASPTHFGRGALRIRLLAAMAARLVRAYDGRVRALPTELVGDLLARHLPLFDARIPLPVRLWEPGQIERPLLYRYLACAFDREAPGVLFDMARWAGERVFDREPGGESLYGRLRTFPTPILFIAGQQDDLVPPASIRPGFEVTRAPRKTWRLFGGRGHRGRYGHVDLVLSRHAPREVWPEIVSWMRAS